MLKLKCLLPLICCIFLSEKSFSQVDLVGGVVVLAGMHVFSHYDEFSVKPELHYAYGLQPAVNFTYGNYSVLGHAELIQGIEYNPFQKFLAPKIGYSISGGLFLTIEAGLEVLYLTNMRNGDLAYRFSAGPSLTHCYTIKFEYNWLHAQSENSLMPNNWGICFTRRFPLNDWDWEE